MCSSVIRTVSSEIAHTVYTPLMKSCAIAEDQFCHTSPATAKYFSR